MEFISDLNRRVVNELNVQSRYTKRQFYESISGRVFNPSGYHLNRELMTLEENIYAELVKRAIRKRDLMDSV